MMIYYSKLERGGGEKLRQSAGGRSNQNIAASSPRSSGREASKGEGSTGRVEESLDTLDTRQYVCELFKTRVSSPKIPSYVIGSD
jgi:hypothetical protein